MSFLRFDQGHLPLLYRLSGVNVGLLPLYTIMCRCFQGYQLSVINCNVSESDNGAWIVLKHFEKNELISLVFIFNCFIMVFIYERENCYCIFFQIFNCFPKLLVACIADASVTITLLSIRNMVMVLFLAALYLAFHDDCPDTLAILYSHFLLYIAQINY